MHVPQQLGLAGRAIVCNFVDVERGNANAPAVVRPKTDIGLGDALQALLPMRLGPIARVRARRGRGRGAWLQASCPIAAAHHRCCPGRGDFPPAGAEATAGEGRRGGGEEHEEGGEVDAEEDDGETGSGGREAGGAGDAKVEEQGQEEVVKE